MISPEIHDKVRQIEIKTSRLVTEVMASQFQSAFKGHGMEFEEVREYQPGDEVRFIDWNVTARMNHPFVKKFVEERELTVMVVVDVSGSGRFGSQAQSKRELAAELACVLALAAHRCQDKVGLILFTEEVELYVPPRKGRRNVLRVVRDILHHQPRRSGTRLDAALEFLTRVSTRKAVVILLSDFLDPLPLKPLRQAHRRHDLVAVQITDRHENELPALGRLLLEDAETGHVAEINTGSASRRESFARQRQEEQAELQTHFSNLGIDTLCVQTGVAYVQALSRFFEKRTRRRTRR
nr:DUF58 domain-containing protein [Pedosphaera sp.]MSU43119.1 DUF58 domain-containing protein [Pedosphaera sp.]